MTKNITFHMIYHKYLKLVMQKKELPLQETPISDHLRTFIRLKTPLGSQTNLTGSALLRKSIAH